MHKNTKKYNFRLIFLENMYKENIFACESCSTRYTCYETLKKWSEKKGVEKYLYRNWSIDSDVSPLSIKNQKPYHTSIV